MVQVRCGTAVQEVEQDQRHQRRSHQHQQHNGVRTPCLIDHLGVIRAAAHFDHLCHRRQNSAQHDDNSGKNADHLTLPKTLPEHFQRKSHFFAFHLRNPPLA